MRQNLVKILLSLILIGITVSCSVSDLENWGVTFQVSATNSIAREIATSPTTEASPTPTSRPTVTPLPPSNGPTLLIQTDVEDYAIVDFGLGITTPFSPPWEDPRFNLAAHLSPSGKQILFHRGEDQVMAMDIRTSSVSRACDPPRNPPGFQVDLAAEQALESAPGLDFTTPALLRAIKNAYDQSKLNFQWYLNDNHLLVVLDGSETSTHLYLCDHQAEEFDQLENAPGFVEDYWVGPDGGLILLKKGYIFEPGTWQDDRYYLVDIDEGIAQMIPLPEDVKHPALFWLSPQRIGIIHQTQLVGGIGFSVFQTDTQGLIQVVSGKFSRIRLWDGALLIIEHDLDTGTTLIEVRTLEGEWVQTKTMDKICFFQASLGHKIFLNCDDESLLVDATLEAKIFDEALMITTSAPDGNAVIVVTRSRRTTILDTKLQDRRELNLEGPPLEIRWLPDSSGFLYRANGKLYAYALTQAESQLLFTSDIFGDYSNLNAVWVNLN